MRHNLNSGRLREYIEFTGADGSKNSDGELLKDAMIFDCRADVEIKGGSQAEKYGTTISSEVITVLAYYDARASSDLMIKWNGKTYSVLHVQPDSFNHSMIVTAEIEYD